MRISLPILTYYLRRVVDAQFVFGFRQAFHEKYSCYALKSVIGF